MQEYNVEVYEGRTVWKNKEGKFHRLDGPAVECSNGTKEWYINGKLHRLDGPAIEYSGSYKAWWVEGKLHRLDGPAREWANGDKEWWLEGKVITEEEFLKRTSPTKKVTISEIVELLGYKVEVVNEEI